MRNSKSNFFRDKLLAKILRFGPSTQQSTDNKIEPIKKDKPEAKIDKIQKSIKKVNDEITKNIVENAKDINRDEKETFINDNEIKPNSMDDRTTNEKEEINKNEIEMDETDDIKILAIEKDINKGDKHITMTGMFIITRN